MSHQLVGGIWMLNRDLGDPAGASPTSEGSSSPNEGRRGGGGGGRMGGGRMGGGGRGSGRDGNRSGEEDLGRQQAIADYLRASVEDSKQLTIVVHEASASITNVDGQLLVLQTNDKKTDERAGNGLVKLTRRNHWDGDTLVSEIEIDNGPKITRSYAPSPGGTQLRVTTTVHRGGRPVKLTHIYERPVESR